MSNEPGMYWHVHHDELCEWCYDPEGRRNYIRGHKAADEVATRLRLMQPVTGSLPGLAELEARHAAECGCKEWNGEKLVFEEAEQCQAP